MKMENTNDLSAFMDQLKDWAKNHGYRRLYESIDQVESTAPNASELIIRYAESLQEFRDQIPEALPPSFRENWEAAIRIGFEAVQTVHYEERDRSIFSLG